jgi:phosphopantothenoylcysteine synthetase/decarboxylase
VLPAAAAPAWAMTKSKCQAENEPTVAGALRVRYDRRMHCIVTAGPTFELLDSVRRLTNFSTGRLGSELAQHLAGCGHDVTLLIGQQASYRGERKVSKVMTFGSTASLRGQLQELAGPSVDAVFHAAAVSDFAFGKVWRRSREGELCQVESGKFSTREGTLLAELIPTPKIIAELHGWFPGAKLIGWKYEVDGGREEAVCLGRKQIVENHTDACVVNGPAYGEGFGLIVGAGSCEQVPSAALLYERLEKVCVRT